MEDVHCELDSVKDELEKLKAEYRTKSELCENLKNAHNKQSLRVEETQQKIEKQSQELKVKCEDISEARQLVEKLESRMQVKESSLRDLISLNEKLKADFDQKVKSLEDENRDLVSTLTEVSSKNKDLEKEVDARSQQIDGLKSLLSVTETKYMEAERIAREGKEYKRRDVVIGVLEDEKANFQDQLKWKKEQFKHLEEAHEKLQDQFQMSEEDWKREKSALVEEICSLQTRLDSQIIATEGLRSRLEMCNNALAHEKSQRRSMEIHVSDLATRFQNAFAQFEGETSEIHILSDQRDDEIAELQNLLETKEVVKKEGEVKIKHLEQENQDLRGLLKELQEAQIRNAGATLHDKSRRLEKAHSHCSARLKEKEYELLSEIEKIRKNLDDCKSELEDKEEEAKKLKVELESCHCKIQELSVEISMIFEVLKSELSETYSTTYNVKVEMDLCKQEKEDRISRLAAQLELSCSGLETARLELEEERKRVLNLMERVKSFELMKKAQEYPEQNKNLLEKSAGPQLHPKEFAGMDSVLSNRKHDISDISEKENIDLCGRSKGVAHPKCNLDNLKSSSSTLNANLGADKEICWPMEDSLAQDETTQVLSNDDISLHRVLHEKDKKIDSMLHQIILLEGKLAAKVDEMEVSLEDQKNLTQITEQKDISIKNLQNDLTKQIQESKRRELEIATIAQLDAAKEFTREKETLLRVITKKEQKIKNLMVLAKSLERDLTSATVSAFQDVVEQQVKIDALLEASDKHKHVTDTVIKEKNQLIADQENEVSTLGRMLTHQEESFLSLKLEAEYFQVLVKCKMLEMKIFVDRQRRMEGILNKLESENKKLSIERESLVDFFQKVCDEVGEFSSEDVEMMKALGKMLPRAEEKIEVENNFNCCIGGKASASISSTKNKHETSINERSPLKEVNLWQR